MSKPTTSWREFLPIHPAAEMFPLMSPDELRAFEAAVACCGIPMTIVEPSQWKKVHHLRGGDKESGRQRALQLFPAARAMLARKKDHCRAVAAFDCAGGSATMKNHRRAQEQKLADDARLLRAWKRWHREERTAVLAGPHGPALAELFHMLDNIEHVRPSQLVGLVQSIAWSTIDYPTRLAVLHETNSAVSKQRERLGLAPFDDGLPGDPPNVFCLIRTAILFAELPAARGGHVGADADLQPATPLSMEQSYE